MRTIETLVIEYPDKTGIEILAMIEQDKIDFETNDYKPIEVSKSIITDVCEKYCVDERNEIYFMAYESEPNKPMSVLWANMDWLRKTFGVVKHDCKSIITQASLNYSRLINIEKMKLAIKLNVNDNDLQYWNGTDFGMMDNYYYGKPNPNHSNMIDWHKEVPRIPSNLTKGRKLFLQKDIDKGLYLICKYV